MKKIVSSKAHFRIALLLIAALLLPLIIIAQKIDNTASNNDINSNHYLRLLYDNDYFGGTDKYYTQGINMEMVDPALRKNPANHILLRLPHSAQKYGVAMELLGFTPSRTDSENILYGDRPYAAAAMIKSFRISNDTLHKNRLSSIFSIGIIGQGVGGKQIQSQFHRMIGNKVPQGWQHQIKNDLAINYELSHEKQLYRYNDLVSLNSAEKLHLVTFNTNLAGGLTAVVGKITQVFTSDSNKNKIQYYGYIQSLATLVGYDATLQGGVFNRSCPYIIHADEISRVTLQHNFGIVIQYKSIYLEYSRTELSKEFKTGTLHKWGGFRIGAKL